MKTRCPNCQTIFRVTPEQLKARAGKVRCGQCQHVFNALDSLLEETTPASATVALPTPTPNSIAHTVSLQTESPTRQEHRREESDPTAAAPTTEHFLSDTDFGPEDRPSDTSEPEDAPAPLSESATQELGKASGLILPRETTEIPGYSKWSEGLVAPSAPLEFETTLRWPFVVAATLLLLALVGQIVYRFRSEIAITVPSAKPALEALSSALGADVPLPRHVDLVSIETSDLQNDPARPNLLILNATLRNRAAYAQAYPSLELSLTDTQDAAIARRVFPPDEYLSPKTAGGRQFAAESDTPVRLWIEAKNIIATGYRLYVFYP